MVLGNISEDDAQGGALAFQGGSCELVQRQIVPPMSWGGMWTLDGHDTVDSIIREGY